MGTINDLLRDAASWGFRIASNRYFYNALINDQESLNSVGGWTHVSSEVRALLPQQFLSELLRLKDYGGALISIRKNKNSCSAPLKAIEQKCIDAFLEIDDSIPPGVDGIYDSEGDTVYLEELLSVINSDPNLPSSPVCEINVPEKVKSSCEDPPDLELKDLHPIFEHSLAKFYIKGIDPQFCTIDFDWRKMPTRVHIREEFNPKIHEFIKQEVIKLLDVGLIYPIADSPWATFKSQLVTHWIQEKTTFTCPYGTFAYRRMPFGLCNAPGTFQRCMVAIFHDMIEKTMEVFMDDFSVFGDSFSSCLSHLDKMLQRCEDTNLVLNWEKCHFMVKEGIVLGHKISKSGIEVDKAKVDVIAKLPHPTTVKGIRSFLGHAGFYRRFIQDFSKIARPMTHLLEKETPFIFSKECIEAFETLKMKLTQAPILVAPDWDLPFEIMCDASDFAVGAVLGQRKTKHFQPIHYASKTMTEAQAHYTTTEKELLAVGQDVSRLPPVDFAAPKI
ncbi:reverse transcriptase domain-containing protein [Tanacetum coccineum]